MGVRLLPLTGSLNRPGERQSKSQYGLCLLTVQKTTKVDKVLLAASRGQHHTLCAVHEMHLLCAKKEVIGGLRLCNGETEGTILLDVCSMYCATMCLPFSFMRVLYGTIWGKCAILGNIVCTINSCQQCSCLLCSIL